MAKVYHFSLCTLTILGENNRNFGLVKVRVAVFNRLTKLLVKMWSDISDLGYPSEQVKNISCPL